MKKKSLNTPTISKIVSHALHSSGLVSNREYSNIKLDEHLVFFNTTAWQSTDEGADERPGKKIWNVHVHGWVYQPQNSRVLRTLVARLLDRKYALKPTPNTEDNFKHRMNLFVADNERRKRVIIELKGQRYLLPKSKPNGHFQGILQIPASDIRADKQGLVNFTAVLSPKDQRTFSGQAQLLKPQGVSVISDIDDTVKRSYITDHKKMFESAFFKDFEPVKGMSSVYQGWHEQGASFHFVSSSPWQLYEALDEFMHDFDFPWATMSLKKIRFKDETFLNLFKSGLRTKPAAIRSILKRYPDRRFVLVGDSGEQDAQVYAQIAEQYPEQIEKIFIRNVNGSNTLNQKYKDVFANIKRRKWSTFTYPSQIKLNLGDL